MFVINLNEIPKLNNLLINLIVKRQPNVYHLRDKVK